MIFKQLFDQETWTYTYLIADPVNKEAVLIDPVNTHIDAYLALLVEHGLQLKYSLETPRPCRPHHRQRFVAAKTGC